MSFTVFSYNARVLLDQPNPTQPNPSYVLEDATQPYHLNPTHGWTQPMSISELQTTSISCRQRTRATESCCRHSSTIVVIN